MDNFKLCVPCLLGLEGPIADELRRMKMQNVQNENGRVYFTGGAKEIAKANINLRIGERVLLELGRFRAETFDELLREPRRCRGRCSFRAMLPSLLRDTA